MPWTLRLDDLSGPEIRALLEEHLAAMRAQSPPESVHALDLGALRQPDVRFWTIWDGTELAGCGALRDLGGGHGEIKSMRTAPAFRRQGVGGAMLAHLLADARARGFTRVSLETGVQPAFFPAHRLYARAGFERCGPFGSYTYDPNSVFMTRVL